MATEAVSTEVRRLEALLDPASFRPLRSAVGDGVSAGSGTVDDRPVFCWAQDGGHRGGSLGTAGGETITRLIALADRAGAPVVGFPESGGARVQEGAGALAAYAAIFRAMANARVPVLSVASGACARGDLTIAAGPDARLFLTGPGVVREVTREEVDGHALGGPRVQGANGVIHLQATDEAHAARLARAVLSYIPPRDRGPRRGPAREPARRLRRPSRRRATRRRRRDARAGPALGAQPRDGSRPHRG